MTTEGNPQGWVPSDQAFAARLALVRNRMGWNLKEAALACGFPPSSWTNWEIKGKRPHDYVRVCEAIAKRTGANFEWLALGPKEETGLRATSDQKPSRSRRAQQPPAFPLQEAS